MLSKEAMMHKHQVSSLSDSAKVLASLSMQDMYGFTHKHRMLCVAEGRGQGQKMPSLSDPQHPHPTPLAGEARNGREGDYGNGRPSVLDRHSFSKVLSIVPLHIEKTRALTYENFVAYSAGRHDARQLTPLPRAPARTRYEHAVRAHNHTDTDNQK